MIRCPYDALPCMPGEVLHPPGHPSAERCHPEHRPCDRCPRFVRARPVARLGRLERTIMVRLPEPNDPAGKVLGTNDKGTHAAAARLVAKGLAWKAVDPYDGRQRLLWLSPLGSAVVARFGHRLRSGRPVYWSARWGAFAQGVLRGWWWARPERERRWRRRAGEEDE